MQARDNVRVDLDRMVLGPGTTLPLERSLTDGAALVRVGAATYRLRPWTFGERRRLARAVGPSPSPEREAWLLDRLAETLVDPVPSDHDRPIVSLAALAWAITAGDAVLPPPPTRSADEQTLAVANHTGWSWQTIDAASARDVDRWSERLGPAAAPTTGSDDVDPDGFRRFVLVEDE